MTLDRGNESAAPNTAAAAAIVNGPPLVPLFDEAGRTIYVIESDVDDRLADGFTRDKLDLGTVREEIPQLAVAVGRTWVEYLDSVERDGYIDTADEALGAVAEQALQLLLGRLGRVATVLPARYPVRQSDGVAMTRGDEATFVDPGQVADYEALGWEQTPVEGGVAMRRELVTMTDGEGTTRRVPRGAVEEHEAIGWVAGDSTFSDITVDTQHKAAAERAGFEEI